ncbi:hypothetical protein [Streptomyces sp. 7N604]|uniref:hypothetical protein n=1 Tax=Streptomyces sp. 7N604 TaxID=3457415 RepID=UPI003FD07262
MHARIVRAASPLASIAVTAGVVGTLTWSPAQATTGQADTYGTAYPKTTGRPLAAAVITINTDTGDAVGKHRPCRKVAQLTTGRDGTAKLKLEVALKDGTDSWAGQTTDPAGNQADAAPPRFTAQPAAQVTVTLADTRTPSTPPADTPPPTPHQPRPPAPSAQLAHAGSDNATWRIGAVVGLVALGGTAVWVGGRRRRASESDTRHH